MPFSKTKHQVGNETVETSNLEWDFIFKEWIKKAVESYPKVEIECIRSNSVPGNFVKGIVQDLYYSDLVIADLTGQKPNVYYELGIRHSLKLGTIIITQDIDALPSDLTSYYCFKYNYSKQNIEYKKLHLEFKKNIHEKIKYILANRSIPDSPVSDFLELKHYFSTKLFEEQKQKYSSLFNSFSELFIRFFDNFEAVVEQKEKMIENNHVKVVFLDINFLNHLYLSLINGNWSELDNYVLEEVMKLIRNLQVVYTGVNQVWEFTSKNISTESLNNLIDICEKNLVAKEGIIQVLNTLKISIQNMNYFNNLDEKSNKLIHI